MLRTWSSILPGMPMLADTSVTRLVQQRSAPTPVAPKALQDGQAETRLLKVYQLASEGRGREALAQAESLAREYPNFQLAQLAVGDLLAARVRPIKQLGDVPEPALPYPPEVTATLDELRTESRQRVQAQRARPASTHIPAQFVELAPRYKHAIAIDASRSRLYLFENTDKGLKLVADYYASVGKSGIEKATEGDQRTPLGVYFITSRLDPATLKDFYGAGALPINYPNPPDQAVRTAPRSSTNISAMVPTQKRPAGSTLPSLKRVVAVSYGAGAMAVRVPSSVLRCMKPARVDTARPPPAAAEIASADGSLAIGHLRCSSVAGFRLTGSVRPDATAGFRPPAWCRR
eukprot:gene35176-43365_t